MKNKILNLVIVSVLLTVVFSNLISAAFTVTPTTLVFNQGTSSQEFVVTNMNNSRLLNLDIQTTVSIGNFVFNITGNRLGINFSEPRTFNVVSQDSNDFSNIEFGSEISGSLLISNANDSTDNETIIITIEDTDFCDYTTLEGLKIRSIDFVNKGAFDVTFGEDETWYPFEEIEAEIEVENSGNYDMSNIDLEWGLYNTNLDKWVIEPTSEDEFDLNSDDNNVVTFTFKIDDSLDVDLTDLTDGKDYVFYARATGKIDDSNSDNDGKTTCVSKSNDVEIVIEKNLVVLDNIKFSNNVSCGSQLQISADAWNIGSKDEKDVYVKVFNKDLGIDEQIDVGDIDSFEKKKLSFTLEIPETAEEGNYYLELSVYDNDDSIYEASGISSDFTVQLGVDGSCSIKSSLSVFAEVVSGGGQGEETTVKVNLTNEGKTATFKLGVSGYESWASFKEIKPDKAIISKGKSEEILITFDLDKDASPGLQDFFLEITLPDGTVETQPISIQVLEKQQGFSITGFFTEGNTFLKWFIVIDIIIILVIVVVAIKILKK